MKSTCRLFSINSSPWGGHLVCPSKVNRVVFLSTRLSTLPVLSENATYLLLSSPSSSAFVGVIVVKICDGVVGAVCRTSIVWRWAVRAMFSIGVGVVVAIMGVGVGVGVGNRWRHRRKHLRWRS